ncbi:DUF72 domain-containing protein, partial [Staphylococcus aureus]|uniref:DUF72 domain-containing protein n=1 Tax=Staphylococcus aureus TaxID=1280 RepID=UPI000AEF2D49
PPWFDCNAQNIKYILYVRQQLQAFSMCVEFRHQSWFSEAFKEQTLAFLPEHQIIHAVVDEPQVKDGSVPLVNRITNEIAFVRLIGRIQYGLTKKHMSDQDWRDVRYLYAYNEQVLID